MKQMKKKKIKKKIKNITEEEIITPTRHEKIGNINFYSEEISKEIIEKIISLVISKVFTNKIEKLFNDFCLDEYFKKTNNLIELLYIDHDLDDFNNSEYVLSKIKYQKTDTNEKRNKIQKHKNAVNQRNYYANKELLDYANINKEEQTEMIIKNKKIEDFLNLSINMKDNNDIVKQDNIQFSYDLKDSNFWGNIPEPKSFKIDRTSNKFNIMAPKSDNLHIIKEVENLSSNKLINNKKRLSNLSNIFKQRIFKNKFNNQILKIQKKFQPILQMPYIEIPDEDLDKKVETDEIKLLRKETLEYIIQKQEELKKLKLSKSKNNQKKDEKKIKNKIIKGKFFTDHEGKIVKLKEIQPESLLKEFTPVMSNQKEILSGRTLQSVEMENFLMKQKAKKNIEYNKGYNFNFYNKSIGDNNKNKDNQNDKKNNKIKILDNLNLIKEEIFNVQTPTLTHISPRYERIELMGSNFSIINPSIGVNIREKDNIKIGGTNFFEKYHKFSMKEFNRTLHETLEWETKTKFKSNVINNDNINNNEIINSEIREEKNLEINKIKEKILRKTFSERGFRSPRNIQKSNSDIFIINEKYPFLKQILHHDNDLYDNSNNYNIKKFEKKSLSNLNIFDRNLKGNKIKKIKYNLVDNFNKQLMEGNLVYNKTKQFLPKLPPRNNFIFTNILNNYSNFNKTTNNFHRTRQKKNIDLFYNLSNPSSSNRKNKFT